MSAEEIWTKLGEALTHVNNAYEELGRALEILAPYRLPTVKLLIFNNRRALAMTMSEIRARREAELLRAGFQR